MIIHRFDLQILNKIRFPSPTPPVARTASTLLILVSPEPPSWYAGDVNGLVFNLVMLAIVSASYAERKPKDQESSIRTEDFRGKTGNTLGSQTQGSPATSAEQMRELNQKLDEIKKNRKQEEATLLELEKGM